MKLWKILARHRWVAGAVITESVKVSDDRCRRYTATIRGFRNWHIWEGKPQPKEVIRRVTTIRDRIDALDETVFTDHH